MMAGRNKPRASRKPGGKTRWQSYSPKTRDRIARQAAEQYGISRRSAREMVNRGTFKPLARDEVARVPLDALRKPDKYRKPGRIIDIESVKDAVIRRMEDLLGSEVIPGLGKVDNVKYNRFAVRSNVDRMTPEQLQWTLSATADQMRKRAAGKRKYNPWHYH